MKNATFFLRQAQYDWLAAQLPEPVVKTKPPIPNGELLNGVLYILKTGCRWQDIPASVCVHDPSSCWRRFSFWRSRGALVIIWREVLGLLDRQGKVDLSLGALDGSLVQSPAFKDGTGYSGKHHRTGTSISLVTDKQGLPLANVLAKGNRHDLTNAEATIRKIRVGAKRRVKQLNADKGYDSRTFRSALRKRGIKAKSLSANSRSAVNADVSHSTTKPWPSSGLLLNVPMLGSSTFVNYVTAGSGRKVCFRPLWI